MRVTASLVRGWRVLWLLWLRALLLRLGVLWRLGGRQAVGLVAACSLRATNAVAAAVVGGALLLPLALAVTALKVTFRAAVALWIPTARLSLLLLWLLLLQGPLQAACCLGL